MTDDLIVDVTDVPETVEDHGDRSFRRKQLGESAGSEDLGCSLYELDPGKRAWLRHYHAGNEEAVFVLDGAGTVRLGPDERERDLSSGDYVALPAGEDGTHEIRAGDAGLRYLMVSTMNDPDITVYPDEGKVGLYAGSPPGGDESARSLSTFLDLEAEVSYWDEG